MLPHGSHGSLYAGDYGLAGVVIPLEWLVGLDELVEEDFLLGGGAITGEVPDAFLELYVLEFGFLDETVGAGVDVLLAVGLDY